MNAHELGAAAIEPGKAADGPDGSTPAALHQLGLRHMQAGRHLDAQLCCERALASDPHHLGSLHLMGLLSLQATQYDHAIAWIARANRLDTKADYLVSLGIAMTQQGLHREAFKALEAALEIVPDDAETWLQLGNALVNLERPADALTSYRRALQLNPRHASAACHCGILLRRLNRNEEALSCFDLCDQLLPDNATVLEQRALVLHDLQRYEEALAANLRMHALNPASAEICNNVGAALLRLSRYEDALPWFDKALAVKSDSVTLLINKAHTLTKILRLDEAFAVYAQARAIDPGNAEVEFLVSELQLLTGNFEAGLSGREARWKTRLGSAHPNFSQPMWLGDVPVAGKTILVYADEGLGDTIQLARYIPMLATRGAQVILVVDAPLLPLLSGLAGVSHLLGKSDLLPCFDLRIPISCLPYAFRTRLETIPAGTAYLPRPVDARVQAWERRLHERLGPRSKLRVGLAWSGNPQHANDRNRSFQLGKLSRLLDLDAAFVSLQKEPRPEDRAQLERTRIIDLTAHLTDLAETAALMSCLDLVITVDTSVAHLAGALGRPTWILLPYAPEYRWLLGRDDSPWYESVRVFRQDQTRDYAPVIERVREALQARLSAWRSVSPGVNASRGRERRG
ncbi:MAG: glycosyltransferase family protein [Bradyrhizobium sp.]|nr:glycosyltransferase family protein [Bradyrhizobium sp.]